MEPSPRARVDGVEAVRHATVARDGHTRLAAFRAVEDPLSAMRSLAAQPVLQCTVPAAAAADLTEQQLLNRYKAGQVSYTEAVTAQASALSARRTVSQVAANRQAAAIALIQALGGGWHAPVRP